jgi:hypothetical protein
MPTMIDIQEILTNGIPPPHPLCPRQILGVRMALAGALALG